METFSYFIIIAIFAVYYILILFTEKRLIHNPTEIIEKFLAVVVAYAGISLIYFSFTGKPFLSASVSDYAMYVLVMGVVSVIWAVLNLLSEFKFFKKLEKKRLK